MFGLALDFGGLALILGWESVLCGGNGKKDFFNFGFWVDGV